MTIGIDRPLAVNKCLLSTLNHSVHCRYHVH